MPNTRLPSRLSNSWVFENSFQVYEFRTQNGRLTANDEFEQTSKETSKAVLWYNPRISLRTEENHKIPAL
jgi:hypothetical protein